MAWWYGQDEERWQLHAPTREEAIAAGRIEFPHEDFMIVNAEQGKFDLKLRLMDVWDLIENQNEDLVDPEGDQGVKDRLSPTREQEAELEAALNKTITEWCERHKFNLAAWAFDTCGVVEHIAAEE